MGQFVRVRAHVARNLDLELFQFDPDLTFAVFFLNADRTIYGRYGSRSDFAEAERDISLEGLAKAMQAALDLHADYPANKAMLSDKAGPKPSYKTLIEYPWAKQRKLGHCAHCHHIGTAQHMLSRSANKPIPDKVLFPFPMPDVVGLRLDPKEKAKVKQVLGGSAAEKAGVRAGDEILTLEGQSILSIADVQWVLHNAGDTAQLKADILRDRQQRKVTLALDDGWRHKSDLSWRATTGMLRRLAFGGMRLEELPGSDRERAGLSENELALRVKRLFRNGRAGRVGFRRGDILVAFDGQSGHASESELLAHSLQKTKRGERIPVTVLRGGKRIDLKLPTE